MATPESFDRRGIVRWVRTMPVIFLLLGLGFGTWLSRLPTLRDYLGASTLQMSIYGLCLAAGSILGLVIAGKTVQRFGPRRALIITVLTQAVTLPGAIAIILSGSIQLGLVVLFIYGFAFATADVAMNVSGANAERSFGRPRLPLMHAGYSTGTVAAMGIGVMAEAFRVPLEAHFIAVFALIAVAILTLIRNVPHDEQTVRLHAEAARGEVQTRALETTGAIPIIGADGGSQPAFSTITGSIPLPSLHPEQQHPSPSEPAAAHGKPSSHGDQVARHNPWRDPRILLIGVIALATGIIDGTASDWLPLALVDGQGLTNELGTLMLGVFFASIMLVRILGSALIARFGRVASIRASAVLSTLGIVLVILAPGLPLIVVGTIAWGLGSGLGWPIAISAAADNTKTAVKDVAAVSALGYGSMLLGPMAFGLLGEVVGLLTAFWALLAFTLLTGLIAHVVREGRSERTGNR